jgi:two-component system heavy metal sensor histidine kinase CusS
MVQVVVRDSGCGIREDDLPRIFDRFYCTSSKSYLSGQGAGLGLAIVKSVMLLHGGSVSIESKQGKGTTIMLCFPAHPQGTVSDRPPPPEFAPGESLAGCASAGYRSR